MSLPIGMIRITRLEDGVNIYVEATRVVRVVDLLRGGTDSKACTVHYVNGTWDDCGEPAEVVAQRYTTIVQAARMGEFGDTPSGAKV